LESLFNAWRKLLRYPIASGQAAAQQPAVRMEPARQRGIETHLSRLVEDIGEGAPGGRGPARLKLYHETLRPGRKGISLLTQKQAWNENEGKSARCFGCGRVKGFRPQAVEIR